MIDYEGEYELQHIRQVLGMQKKTINLFDDIVRKVMSAAGRTKWDGNKVFQLEAYPRLQSVVIKEIQGLELDLQELVISGIEASFKMSAVNSIEFNKTLLTVKQLSNPAISKVFLGGSKPNLDAFIKRVEDGMNLSDRIWQVAAQMRTELEQSLAIMLRTGMSAREGVQFMKKYLKEPDKVFRQVRDSKGNLKLSKAAKAYNPGRGVYRSSFKNAFRVTRTETNIAYRTAENQSWLTNPSVVGFEVRTGNNHPKVDICDDMAGSYPKEFEFTGWHPQCMCHAIPILASKAERSAVIDAILAGEDVSKVKIDYVKSIPEAATRYIENNADKIATYKNQPYWVKDNFEGGDILNGLKGKLLN